MKFEDHYNVVKNETFKNVLVFYFYRSIKKIWRIWLLEIKCLFEINMIKEFLIHKIVMNYFMFVIDLGQTKFDVNFRLEEPQFANGPFK